MNDKKRDPERLKAILDLLQEIWESNPDMRFFQLVDFLTHEYSSRNSGFGKRDAFEIDIKGYKLPISYIDLFYLEDKDFEEFLKSLIENRRNA